MPTFYEIDSTRVTFREYTWGTKNPLALLIGGLLKVFKVRIPSSSDDPNVDSTLPFIVDQLPHDVAVMFVPLAEQLQALGFCDPVYHFIEDHGTQSRVYWATFRHYSGQHCARIHHRYWGKAQKPNRGLFPMFITWFMDGTFLVSSSGKPDVAEPETVLMNRMPKASAENLWTEHQR